MLREGAERPLEQVLAAGPTERPNAAHLEGVRELQQVDVLVAHLPAGNRRARVGERRHQVPELCAAVVEPCRRVRYLEAERLPEERAPQVGKAEHVDVREGAGKIALQLVAALEQVERPLE